MKLSMISDCWAHLDRETVFKKMQSYQIDGWEITTGNWSQAPHFDLDAFLHSRDEQKRLSEQLEQYELVIPALNCSGNPVHYPEHLEVTKKTFAAAQILNVKKIVMMSGLPAGSKEDQTPCWITTSWPPETQTILQYQWEDVLIPFWEDLTREAASYGIKRIALENHGFQLVYNVETLFKLRSAVGSMIGLNLDPSHMFWMGVDPISAARELGDAIYHVHLKDTRIENRKADCHGLLDTKTIDQFADRSWNYVAVGAGHDVTWWRTFLSTVYMQGYDDFFSLEMEDLTVDADTGVKWSMDTINQCR